MNSELATVRGVLASLRATIRRAWTVRGVAFSVAALCAIVVVSFGLDYFLDLPLAVRAVHLCLMVVCLALVVRWALVRPLATPMSEIDLAQAVEHGAPDLRDRLVSALDFETRLGDATEPESRELMAGVVRDAAVSASRLDASLLVDSRPTRRSLGVAAAAIAVVAVVAMAMPEDFALWVRRGLFLSDTPWPRRTHIHLIDFPTDKPRVITRGEDLRVVAVAEGEAPPELTLHYEELSDPDLSKDPDAKPEVIATETRRMFTLEGEGSSDAARYAFDFRAVTASFRMWVTGGDDQDDDPVYSVVALVPPRVAKIEGTIDYPAYSGLPQGQVRESSFEVLKGSHVTLKLDANMPLAIARMVPTDKPVATNVPLGADGRSMKLEFDVEEPIDFHLELTASQGQTNRPEDDVFHLKVAVDRPPELRVLYPPSRLYRTPAGFVPVKFIAKDDFQIAKVTLEVVHGTTPSEPAELWPKKGAAAPPGGKPADPRRVDAYERLDLRREFGGDKGRELKPADVVSLTLRVADSHGNETTSGGLAVEILSPEDLERRLSQKQSTLREELAIVRRNQQRTRTAISDLRTAAAGAPLDQTMIQRGRDLQVDQGRVTNDLSQFLRGVQQVFDSYVMDRVGAGTTIDKLEPLYEAALSQPSDEEVFPASLYRKIVEEKRADRIFDSDVLGALLDIMDLSDRAVSEASPSVYSSLVKWSGDREHDAAELERAEKGAADLATLLYQIDQRMQRWGDLNLLIEMAREILHTEETLSKDPAGTRGLAPK